MTTLTRTAPMSVLIIAVALCAAACSQAGDSTTSTTTSTAETTAAGTDDLVRAGADTPGVTDEIITLAFVVVDTSKVAAAFGWDVPDEGDRAAQIEALVADANANGGIAGSRIDAKIHVYDAITDGPVAEERLCNAITQDDKAFAVVLFGQFQENARPCYANAKTLMFDATLYPIDQTGYDELAPYLWSPFLPSYDDIVSGLATGLIDNGWFDEATVGVIAIESDLSQRVYDEQFLPRLTAAGVEVASYNTIDPTDGTAFNNDQLQAIVNFKQAGVNKVVGIGGSRLVSWFIDTSITQNFAPAYAITSHDAPEFNVFNYPEMLPGSSGISVLPGFDVNDDQYAFPSNDAEAQCLDTFTAAGLPFESRANVRSGLLFCDSIRLLTIVGSDLDELSAQGVSEAIWRLGAGFQSAAAYDVTFEEGSYTGASAYHSFAFDEGCQCMATFGDTMVFGE